MQQRFIVADDDENFAGQIAEQLLAKDLHVEVISSAPSLTKALFDGGEWTAVIIEPNLRGGIWYSTLLSINALHSRTKFTIVSSYGSRAMEKMAGRTGHSVLWKPIKPEAVVAAVCDEALVAKTADQHVGLISLARNEWEYINETLYLCSGNLSAAARVLRVPRQTLYRKLRKHPPSV